MIDKRDGISIIAVSPIWVCFAIFLNQLGSYAVSQRPMIGSTIMAFLSVGFLPIIFFRLSGFRPALLAITSSFALILICFCLSALIYDTSFDGQTYHQLAVSLFEGGWNCFSSNLTSETPKLEYLLPLRHYPKFPWLVESALYGLTGNLEGAKSLNLILLICSALLAFLAAEQLNFSRANSLLFSLALALNPVSICQIWTFYIDGLLASTTLIFLSSVSLFFSTRQTVWAHASGLALIILLNIKFTAVVVIASFFAILIFVVIRGFPGALKLFKFLVGYLLVGAFVIGWHPYVTNFLLTGNPIYPVAGYSPIGKTPAPKDWPIFSLIQGQQPEVLRELQGPIKTLLSVGSRAANPIQPAQDYEFFWKGRLSDFSRFTVPDLRLGGFGPIFPLALLSSLLALVFAKRDVRTKMLLSVCAFILLSSLLNPESWWSRYSPQIWMLPALMAATSGRQFVFSTIFGALILNSTAILLVNTQAAYLESAEVEKTLTQLVPYQNSTLPGSVDNYFANKFRLSQMGINLSSPDNCLNKIYFAGSPSFVCLPS